MSKIQLDKLSTEQRNEATMYLDQMTTPELLHVMNQEDGKVVEAVKQVLPDVAKAVDLVVDALKHQGRLIYIGAGTSGRLGILDASECPPTFSTTNEIQGIMAGGDEAIRKAKEGAEDSHELAKQDLQAMEINEHDVICGLAASGRTPYVIGGLQYARSIGAKTIAISCNQNSEISKDADVAIEVLVGPEVLTGSTRLKAGTAQKMVLNMISTASMVRMGKVYGNLMVDVKASNLKLMERCKRIVMQACACSYETAQATLEQCEYRPKAAIIMILLGCDYPTALTKLDQNDGFVRKAIQNS